MSIVPSEFFHLDAQELAKSLLGKVLRKRYIDARHGPTWLSARIIETEAYYLAERGSHASLGFTEKRRALFMPAGTLYMYYARGKDSLNISAEGEGNAVLIKSGHPHVDALSPDRAVEIMQGLNPGSRGPRPKEALCAGQTLLCSALGLKVVEWDKGRFDPAEFYLDDIGDTPSRIIQCRRLGIPGGRDEHLPYRFVDARYAKYCTSNPLTRRGATPGTDYRILGDN